MTTSWPVRPLADLLEVQNGYAFDSKQFHESKGMPLIRIRDLKNGCETETRYLGDYDERYVVRKGDLLIGMDGEFGCYEWQGGPGLLNQRVCRLQGFRSELEPRFLLYGLNSYLKSIEDQTAYATVKHLSSKQVLAISLPLPPKTQQQRIVRILDEAVAGITTAKANVAKNLQNARLLFETAEHQIFGCNGARAIRRPLGKLVSFRNGINYTKSSKGERVHVVGVGAFQDHFTVPDQDLDEVTIDGKLDELDLLKQGDLLTVRSNGNPALIGRCMLAEHVRGRVTHSGFTIRLRPNTSDVVPSYLCYFMRSADTRSRLTEGGTGTNIKSLNQAMLSELIVPVPSIMDQRRLVEELCETSATSQRLSTLYQQKGEALNQLKTSLLQQAFSGAL